MEMREDYPPCQWHANPTADTADRMLLKYIDNAKNGSPLFTRLETDLMECWDCVEVYHEARERLVHKEPQTDKILLNLEGTRVKESLRQETGNEELEVLVLVIHEVTEHPFLLFNQEIASAFCSKLVELNSSISLEPFLPHCIPSMYLLVIHPRREIRELAWQCLQQPKYHITSDLYDGISPVLSWVLINNTFAALCDQVSHHQTPSMPDVLPPHLICTQSPKSYWQGVARLFEILSEDTLKHRFMNSIFHKQFIPVLIDAISIPDEDTSSTESPFWWQLQCLTYLMHKLGSNVWLDISRPKFEGFFDVIKKLPVFLRALDPIVLSDHNSAPIRRDPSAATQSLLLVDPSEPVQWIVPYINSLLDFGDSASSNFSVVITFLYSKLSVLLRLGCTEQRGDSDSDVRVKVRLRKPLESLIEKLMLVLVRVLRCLHKNSLLGALVAEWLGILLEFLKQHPPVCSESDISRLCALSNESRQLLIDVFSSSKKHNSATIAQSVRYTKMLSLPLSAAKPGSSGAQNVDRKRLWEIDRNEKEFRDCVEFVERTLQAMSLTSRFGERNHAYQLLDSPKQSLMDTRDINTNALGTTQLSSSTKSSNAPGCSSSLPPSEHSESILSQVGPTPRHPRRNLADEFLNDLKPCQDKMIGVQSSLEWQLISDENEIIQITDSDQEYDDEARTFKVEDQTLPNISTSKHDNGSSSNYKPPISSGDEVALISDVTEKGESSSSLEDIFGTPSFQTEPQKEKQQIETEGGFPRTDWTYRLQDSRWQPRVVLERVPELEELDWSKKQVMVTSIRALVISKVEPHSKQTRPECSTSSNMETTEDMASSDSVSYQSLNHNVFQHKEKQEKMQNRVQEGEEFTPLRSYLTQCPPTHVQPLGSFSNLSLSGSSSPKTGPSPRKYPKNRLSLKKRNKRKHIFTSSSDEDEVKTQILNPDIPEIKQPQGMMEVVKKGTCDDQTQGLLMRGNGNEQEDDMDISESSLSCHKDNSKGGRIYTDNSNEITEIAEVGQDDASSDEDSPGKEGMSSLIADDDKAKQDLINSHSDDSEDSQSLLTPSHPPKVVPSPQDSSFSRDTFIKINKIEEDKPTTFEVEGNNNHVSPDNHVEEFTLTSGAPDEDIKPIPRFIKLKRKSSFSSSLDDSSMLSYTEDHQEDDEIIDLESYNCSQLFDEDRFSQLIPCIEISSGSDIDLDAPEPELNIDLEAVKQEREDSDRDESGTDSGILPESQSEDTLDSALLDDNDGDTMWYEEEDDSNDGDDERAGEDDVNDEDNGDEDDDAEDVVPMENLFAEVQTISVESEEETASREKNEKLTTKIFYGKKSTKRHSLDAVSDDEDEEDVFSIDQQTVSTARRLGQKKEKKDLTWKSIEAEAVSKKKQRKIKQTKRRMKQGKQRHGLAGQGTSKLATTQKGTVGVIQSGVDVPCTTELPVAAPRVKGSWKVSKQQPLESTPTDAEPMKTVDSSEQPVVTDTFALDDSQTYQRHKPSNPRDDKPRAAMQSVANRFKSRNSVLTQEIKKDKISQRDGLAKTIHSSCGQDVGASTASHDSLNKESGPSRERHASSLSSVRQIDGSLSTPSSSSGVLHDVIDKLPSYAQPVYNIEAIIKVNPAVFAARRSVQNVPRATEPSCSDARLTNPEHVHVELVSVTPQHQKGSSQPSPSEECSSAISGPAFQFFTSDPQTLGTAAFLSSNAANEIKKSQTSFPVLHQTQNSTCEEVETHNQAQTMRQPYQTSRSHNEEMVAGRPLLLPAVEINAKQGGKNLQRPNPSQPHQRSKSYNEGTVAGQPPSPQATEVSAKPGFVLQSKEAVRLPKTSGLTEEDLFCWVIGWDSQWLDICGPDAVCELRLCPPILAECPYRSLQSVPLSFDSVQEYYHVFIPLLLHEIWAQIQNKVNTSQAVPALFVEVKQREKKQTGFLLNCTCRVTVPVGMCPMSCFDLLRVSPSDNNAFCRLPLLAVVTDIVPPFYHDSPSKVSDPSHQAEGKSWDVSFLILAKNEDIYRALLSMVNHNVQLEVIQSLLPALRQFRGLTSLPKLGIIASDILRFRRMDVYCPAPAPTISSLNSLKQLTKSQVKAISVALQAIAQPDTLPRICMIQGPPGTGKTHAVLELAMKLLRSRMERASHHPHPGRGQQGSTPAEAPPILLCAPSNTAIDILVRHLVLNKGDISCRIVRVGRSHHIHHTIREFGIERLVQSQRAKESSNNLFRQTRKKKIAELIQKQILELMKGGGPHKMSGEKNEFARAEQISLNKQLKIVQSEIKDLQRQQAEFDRKPNSHYETDIMNNADIVCCTVNGCGSKLLYRNNSTDGKLKMMKFSCVIMDEANQCSELDSLIALQNCSMKVVLVGDTKSQPPTVTSKIAWQYRLHQSLFERLCHLFELAEGTPSPVHYLQIQLRMHPAISQFPIKHFYRGRVVDDKRMAQKREAFFLRPYLVFNVSEGKEVQAPSRNFTNEEEADMVQAVYHMICEEKRRNQTMLKELMSVGITTPYKEQAQCLHMRIMKTREEIKRSFPSEFVFPVVEVSILDLFRGREKDVIILCCVRANGLSNRSALGLVGDRKVMNVSITRARYSLFIVGHLPTLQRNSDWDALVTDARRRKLLIDVHANEYSYAARYCSKSIEKLQTNTGNTTQTAPSFAPQSQIGQNVAQSDARTGMSRSYSPHKMVESRLEGSKPSCGPQTQVDPRRTEVLSPPTSGDKRSTSGTNGVNAIDQSTVDRNPKPLTLKSNIASPNAKKSPRKQQRVSFQGENNQALSEKSIQLSLTPKPMQPSNTIQSPTKHNPYRTAFQNLKSQKTSPYNKLGWKRRSPKRQNGIQHSRPVDRVPHELSQIRRQPVVAQLSGKTTNNSPSRQGKTQPAMGEHDRQRSTASKSLRHEQPNQKPATRNSNGSHHTHRPGSPGYRSVPGLDRMTAVDTSGPSGKKKVSTHPKRNATVSSPAKKPTRSHNRLTVPLQTNVSSSYEVGQPGSSSEVHQPGSSSEVHQPGSSSEVRRPSASGSGQLDAAPTLQEAVENVKRKHANTMTTRALPGLQPDPRQVRRQRKQEARIMEHSSNDPERIPYSNRVNTPFD